VAYSPSRALLSRSISIIYSHPYPTRSRAGRTLLDGVRDLPGATVRALYALYPDFDIDVKAEQDALLAAEIVVWQGPFYWYGVPALMSLWFEKVLTQGWAYGEGGNALRRKTVLWVATTGAPETAYRRGAMHDHAFEAFVPALSQTARFCGMEWVDPPVIVHAAHRISDPALREAARAYRTRLAELASPPEEAAAGGRHG
jgi:glutathione-regulated potassium-efflux system ancillary protein KefF